MTTAEALRCAACGKLRAEGKVADGWWFLVSGSQAKTIAEAACSMLCLQAIVTKLAAVEANADRCVYDTHAGVWTGPADCPRHGIGRNNAQLPLAPSEETGGPA